MNSNYDVIIVGGGAAGVFSAINTAKNNQHLNIAILEKTTQLLSKVKVSGGGRCNVTHACFEPKELVKFYPRGSKELLGAFYQFQPTDTINWFKERNVELKTEIDGRMFPVTDNSQTIIDCFTNELTKYNIDIFYNTKVEHISKNHQEFELITNQNSFKTTKLLITTGGFNKLEHYQFITQLGITIEPPTPSLFTFNLPNNPITELQGIATPAKVKLLGTKFEEQGALLITHWGMSGPVILKLSAWASKVLNEKNYEFDFMINWLLDKKDDDLNEIYQLNKQHYGSKKVINQFEFGLPKKLAAYLINKAGIGDDDKWADVSKKQLNKLTETLLRDTYHSSGKTTFKSEFVSCGGVKLNEINFKTMESKKIPNLYFAGEVLDVDALTGGFNFQAAWTTGWIAGQELAK
ncbi:MAG: NAD(P)/FAD-dependent oxidoreductase [Flavobacteriales bacterium]|nr:NAD(P)/FAD-dependent oxidoreductase [Flavobacteriales bacterium]